MTMEAVRTVTPLPESTHASEAARIAQFTEALHQVEAVVPIETAVHLDGETPTGDAATYFERSERRAGTNLHVHPNHAELARAGEMTFLPRRTRGKKSAHGVFFGDMFFANGAAVPVAVKPHADDPVYSAGTDYFSNEAARTLGLKTLEPVGMLVDAKGNAYSLTVRDDSLRTLESFDWKRIAQENPEQFTNTWSQVARQAAMLHSMGKMAHGDFAIRNIAVGLDGGVFAIDWEHAELSTQQPRDSEVRYSYSRKDMGELMESLVRSRTDNFKSGNGLLTDHPEPWEAFNGMVFAEYAATREGFAKNPEELRDIRDELTELQASLRAEIGLILRKYGQAQPEA